MTCGLLDGLVWAWLSDGHANKRLVEAMRVEKLQARGLLVHLHDQKQQRLRRRCDYTLLRRAGRRQLVDSA